MNTEEQDQATLAVKLEIYKHHQSEIKKLQKILKDLDDQIVDAYCPYKTGERVQYAEWWNERKKLELGVVYERPRLSIDKNSIDGLWKLYVQPVKKDFSFHQGRNPVMLGKSDRDIIKHYEEPK